MPNTILNAFRGDGECCDDCETVVVEDCGCSEGDGCPKCEILKDIVNPPDGDVPFPLQCTIPSSGGNIEFIFVWCYRDTGSPRDSEQCRWVPCNRTPDDLPVRALQNTVLTYYRQVGGIVYFTFGIWHPLYERDITFINYMVVDGPEGVYQAQGDPSIYAELYPVWDCREDFERDGYDCNNCHNLRGCGGECDPHHTL